MNGNWLGTGLLTKAGSGTLVLAGSSASTSGVTVSAGLLNIQSSNALGVSGVVTQIGTTAAIQLQGGITIPAGISFQTSNPGTGTFPYAINNVSGTNTILGQITMTSGAGNTVIRSDGGSLNLAGTITSANTRTLFLQAASTVNTISGRFMNSSFTNSVDLSGGGTWIFTGANTYTGTTTINGGTMQVGNSGTTGSLSSASVISGSTGATLAFNLNSTTSFSNPIGGGLGIVQAGSGVTILSGSNTYTGATSVSAGTLKAAKTVSLYNGNPASWTDSNLTISSGAMLALMVGGTGEFVGTDIDTLKALGTGTTGLASGASLGLDPTNAPGGVFTYDSSIGNPNGGANALSLVKLGTGRLVLTNTNSYTGATTVSSGTLQLGNGGATGSISGSGAITNNGTMAFNRSDTVTQGTDFGIISGTGAVVQAGSGILVLTNTNSYTGATTVASGTLQLGNGGTAGSISGSGAITNNGTLVFNRSNSITQGADFGVISGTGSLVQTGSGTLVLTGTSTFSGATTINPGSTLQFSDGGKLTGSSTIVNNGLLSINRSTTLIQGTDLGAISGTGSLVQAGSGTLVLAGTSTFSGVTTINPGSTLQFSNGGKLTGSSAIVNNGLLVVNRSTTLTQGSDFGVISGSGAFTNTAGTTIFNAANTYTGDTNLTAGTLLIGADSALGSGALNINGSGSIGSVDTTPHTIGNNITLNANPTISGSGNLTFNGALQSGTAARTITVSQGATVLTLNGDLLGTGLLTKSGSGTLVLAGSNSSTSGVTVSAGILNVQNGNAFGASGIVTVTGLGAGMQLQGGITIPSGIQVRTSNPGTGTVPYAIKNVSGTNTILGPLTMWTGYGDTVIASDGGSLNLAGTITSLQTRTLFLQAVSTVNTISGAIVNGGVNSVDLSGGGTWIFSGSNTYTGNTTVNGSTLQLGNSGSTGRISPSSAITNNGTLAFNRSNTLTQGTDFASTIAGTGNVTQAGSGTTILSASNSYSGGTTVNAGALSLGSDAALGATSGTVTLNGGSLQTSASFDFDPARNFTVGSGTGTLNTQGNANTIAGALSGAGTLAKSGSGTLILSGSIGIGGLSANEGTVSIGQSGTIGAMSVGASGTVTLTAHTGVYNVIDTSSLSIAAGGSIDLWNNAMVLRASGTSENAANLATVKAAVNAASHGLKWDGVGFGSTTAFNEAQTGKTQALALMVYDNTVIKQAGFEGVSGLGYFDESSNPVGFNQVLVKLTYLGDFNADGVINASDYTWLDGFALGANTLGDLNGDGVVNATDYTWLDGSALNQSFGVLAGASPGNSANGDNQPALAAVSAGTGFVTASPEAVPEPGVFGLLLTGAMSLLGTRRKAREARRS